MYRQIKGHRDKKTKIRSRFDIFMKRETERWINREMDRQKDE